MPHTIKEKKQLLTRVRRIKGQADALEKALAALTDLVQKYPTSEYASDARYRINVARDQIAGNYMEIGRFYLEQRNYTAAINRFRDVVSKYQTTRHVEEALERAQLAGMTTARWRMPTAESRPQSIPAGVLMPRQEDEAAARQRALGELATKERPLSDA